ncbi:MAG: hypothetical protein IPP77_07850 [Bacteroidetes bacterium]|nr:hypothetical protein [Bacteroidota bacterium]
MDDFPKKAIYLKQYDRYLGDYLDTFAYCLLPNHFHLLVRVKENFLSPSTDAIPRTQNFPSLGDLESLRTPEQIVSEQFRRMLMSYAKAINKQESRTGSLFQKNFKRIEVENEHYFGTLIRYIHANPETHGLADDFKEYPYSSYSAFLSDKPSKLMRQEALDWFGSMNEFRAVHDAKPDMKNAQKWVIED